MNPKISVIMSVYNDSKFLTQAINSILAQTFGDFEFIIVDDASTDPQVLQILQQFSLKDSRIKIIVNEENLGLTKSLNKALRLAKGEYIARIDADDISYPERFMKQIEFLDQNTNCALVGTWAEIINDQGEKIKEVKYPITSSALKKCLIKFNPFFHSSIMLCKEALDEIGFYNEDFKFAQDYELYFRIAQKFEMANIPDILIAYRDSANSITSTKNRKQISFVIKAKIKALKGGQYSKIYYLYLFRSFLAWLLPLNLKRISKKLLHL